MKPTIISGYRQFVCMLKRFMGARQMRVALAVLGLLAAWHFRDLWVEGWALFSDREALTNFVETQESVAAFTLALLLIVQVIIAVIPGHALMVANGFLFGFTNAFVLSLVATVTGSQLAFLISRYGGRPSVLRLVAAASLDKWDEVARSKGAIFFMFSFMVPIFPADVLNYVAGLSAVDSRKFFVANFFGRIPGVILLTLLGSHGFSVPPVSWLCLIPVTLGMYWLLRQSRFTF